LVEQTTPINLPGTFPLNLTENRKFDVVIVGAGPSGSAAAIALQSSDLSVALLDKAVFPRDKICGDALSVDVVNQLKFLSPSLAEEFEAFADKAPSYGVKIFAPDRNHIDLPFIYNGGQACGYISQRIDFDSLLVKHIANVPNVSIVEGCEVFSVKVQEHWVELETSKGIFTCKIVIGADGAHSIVAKKLQNSKLDKDHYSAGLRMYYEGVTGFHNEKFIELHFFKDILPGYLWIFPLPNNKANVGIGMLSSAVSQKKINLREMLNKFLSTDGILRERFKSANAVETIKGFGLPLGSKQRQLSGDRYVLTGDAASLIDPFSGEGIANAIRSGRAAASHVVKCFKMNEFSGSFNLEYDRDIYRRMWNELHLSRRMQKLCAYPLLFNFIVRKANQNPHIHQFLIDSLANIDKKRSLIHPRFYYRMLFPKQSP
jgi:geranylgeranyl reductase family protein